MLTTLAGNILTQAGLWILLMLIWQPYWPIFLVAEVVIWIVEGLLMALPANHLTLVEAMRLSLWMNLVSFGVGLVLPV